MTHAIEIRTATRDDEMSIGATAVLAFAVDPFVRWLHPDPHKFIEASGQYPALAAGPAFENGSIFVTDDLHGFALWSAPGVKANREAAQSYTRPRMDPAVVEVCDKLLEETARYRPADPHWYLSVIAVDPARRGLGYGTALLRHGLAACDRDRLPAYLESTNAANLSLYERHGFEVLAEVQVDGSPMRYPMLRAAR